MRCKNIYSLVSSWLSTCSTHRRSQVHKSSDSLHPPCPLRGRLALCVQPLSEAMVSSPRAFFSPASYCLWRHYGFSLGGLASDTLHYSDQITSEGLLEDTVAVAQRRVPSSQDVLFSGVHRLWNMGQFMAPRVTDMVLHGPSSSFSPPGDRTLFPLPTCSPSVPLVSNSPLYLLLSLSVLWLLFITLSSISSPFLPFFFPPCLFPFLVCFIPHSHISSGQP